MKVERRSKTARCSLTNGRKLFWCADGRSHEARLLIDREHDLIAALGSTSPLNFIDRLRVKSAALLSVRLELARAQFARGECTTEDKDLAYITDALSRRLTELETVADRP